MIERDRNSDTVVDGNVVKGKTSLKSRDRVGTTCKDGADNKGWGCQSKTGILSCGAGLTQSVLPFQDLAIQPTVGKSRYPAETTSSAVLSFCMTCISSHPPSE